MSAQVASSGVEVSSPRRIQRSRLKGWRMPEGAVYVGRPTVWGNPWTPEDAKGYNPFWTLLERTQWAVRQYVRDAQQRQLIHYDLSEHAAIPLADVPALLRGKDLACWCPLDQPCHADYLLEIANA